MGGLGKQEPAFGFRDRASKFPGGLEPLGDHGFGVGQRLLPRGTIGRATCQLRHFGDERFVFITPIEDDLVLCR